MLCVLIGSVSGNTYSWTYSRLSIVAKADTNNGVCYYIKSSVAKLGLVAGLLNGFYVIADTEEIRWDLIAREVNQISIRTTKDGSMVLSVVA